MGYEYVEIFIFSLALTLPRIAAAFAVLPFLSRKIFTGALLRNGFTMSVALFLVPVNLPQFQYAENLSAGLIFVVLAKEVLIGAVIGFIIAIPFWAIEAVGFLIDNQRGATMASSLNPLSGTQTSPTGLLLNQMMTVLFFSSGAILIFLGLMYESYLRWPILDLSIDFNPSDTIFFLSQLDLLMMLTVVISGPIVIGMFIAEFCFALVNRFTPQLNVFILSMPVKSAVSNILLIFYMSSILYFIGENTDGLHLVFKRVAALYYE